MNLASTRSLLRRRRQRVRRIYIQAVYSSGFSPASLFLSGESGVWFDPSDLTSMYIGRGGTDDIETNPTVGDSVGYIFDKSQLGGKTVQQYVNDTANNLCTNPDFTDGTTGWTATQSDITAVDGELRVSWNNTGNFPGARFTFTPEAGATYYVSARGRRIDAGSVSAALVLKQPANVTAIPLTTSLTGETLDVIYRSPSTTNIFVDLFVFSGADSGDVAFFDDVKIVEIPGNHYVADSDGARPALQQDAGGRYYLDFAVSDSMTAASYYLSGSSEAYVCVAQQYDTDGTSGFAINHGADASGDHQPFNNGIAYDSFGSTNRGTFGSTGDWDTYVDAPMLYILERGSTALKTFANGGTQIGSDHNDTVAWRSTGTFPRMTADGSARRFYGKLELGRLPTTAERNSIEAFFASRTGVTLT